MSASLVSIILIVTPPGASWDTAAMSQAIRQVVDAGVTVSFRAAPPADAEAKAMGQRAHADLVAEVQWIPDAQPTVALHVYLAKGERWVDHTIHFDPVDAPLERARTIGFAVASILPESARPPAEAPLAQPAAPAAAPEPRPAPVTLRRSFVGAVDGGFAAATAIDGYGGGYGGALAGSVDLSPHWSVRLGLLARVGEIAPAQATTNAAQAVLGLRLGAYARPGAPFGWGARADAGVMRYEIVHLSSDDPEPDHRIGWTPVFAATLEGSALIREGIEAVASGGAEAVTGRGQVYTHLQKVADIAVLRVALGLGVRVRF